MPFGLMNVPSTFHRMVDDVLRGLDFIRVYLGDFEIISKSSGERMKHLKVVLERNAGYELKIKITICSFAEESMSRHVSWRQMRRQLQFVLY